MPGGTGPTDAAEGGPKYPYASTSPRRIAYLTNSTRSRIPSLRSTLPRCDSTVFSDRWRISAIWAFV